MKKSSQQLLLPVFLVLFHFSSGQWTQTEGPYGGRITDITTDGNYVYASATYDIFRSSDEGQTWSSIGAKQETWSSKSGLNLYEYPIRAIAVSGNTIVVGTSFGVYRSLNNGTTWENATNSPDGINDIIFSGTTLFAATDIGIHRSTDNGNTWTIIKGIDWGYTVFSDGSRIYAGGAIKGIYRSGSNGDSFTLIDFPDEASGVTGFTKLGTDLYACTINGSVYKSTDNGLTWTAANNGLNASFALAIIANNGNLFVATSNGYFKSTDNAASWTKVGSNVANGNSFAASGNTLFAATSQGVISTKTNEGSLWSLVNTGLTGTQITTFLKKGSDLYCGTSTNGVFRLNASGTFWVPWGFGSIHPNITTLVLYGSTILAGTDGGFGLYQWKEGGNSWSPLNVPFKQVSSLQVIDGKIYVGTFQHIYRSEDNGETWTEISTGLDDQQSVTSFVSTTKHIFAGVRGNQFGGIYRLHTNGTEWVPSTSDISGTESVNYLLSHNDTLYAVTSKSFYTSTDHGENWTAIDLLPYTSGASLAITGEYLILTADKGVYFSSLKTQTWQKVDKGFPRSKISIGPVIINGDKLFVGSDASGVWHMDADLISTLITGVEEFRHQLTAYPNPATRELHINLREEKLLPGGTIQIFDVHGQEQTANVRREGNTIIADVNSLSEGVYILKVSHRSTALHVKFIKQ